MKERITILDNFSIHSNSSEFSNLINFILYYKEDDEDDDQYLSVLEITLSELRDYGNPASRISKDNAVLRSTIIFFTVITSLVYSVLNFTLFNLVWQ